MECLDGNQGRIDTTYAKMNMNFVKFTWKIRVADFSQILAVGANNTNLESLESSYEIEKM